MHVPQSEDHPDKTSVFALWYMHSPPQRNRKKLPKTVSKLLTDSLDLSEVSVATTDKVVFAVRKTGPFPNWPFFSQIVQSFCGKSRISVDIWSRASKSEYVGLSYSDKYS